VVQWNACDRDDDEKAATTKAMAEEATQQKSSQHHTRPYLNYSNGMKSKIKLSSYPFMHHIPT
jgi:hypothetical protein